MGKVVVSSEDVVELAGAMAEGGREILQRRRGRRKDAVEGSDGDGLVKWERFLPKIALRVLLVEADDSTRQIVGALLRKSSYRVVAVPDGLKAWEVLKGRAESVDLVLTEVDLPSISGYTFLTLIMEHEICKNIPVIMMSTQDSVSTVYKCMLKGAADYLVKPLRRNELRNLWRHVWRRQLAFAAGDFSIDESSGQQKLETMSENNSRSNHGHTIERPIVDKGSDAHSSCTSPELEGESVDVDNNNQRDLLQGKSLFNDMEVVENETRRTQGVIKVSGDVHRESCKEAIDFMGAPFRRNEECNRDESTAIYGSMLELDLSLRRSNASENQSCLWPSRASAFTRYVYRPLQTQRSDWDDKISSDAATLDHSNSSGPAPSADQTAAYNRVNAPGPPLSRQSSYPAPIPVKGIRFSCQNSGFTYAVAPAQSSPLPMTSPTSVTPHEYSSRFHPLPWPRLDSGIPECSQEHPTPPNPAMHKVDSAEERRYVSSLIGGLCNGLQYGSVSGSTRNADQKKLEKKNEDTFPSPNGKTLQREAALTKFRMKRKDRCFEKKVRYESRKKLAEQRPRVKGQFVRQAQVSDPSTTTQSPDAAAEAAQV